MLGGEPLTDSNQPGPASGPHPRARVRPNTHPNQMIDQASYAVVDVLHPWRALLHRLLVASRFSPPRLYRILWGQHRRPATPAPLHPDTVFAPLPTPPAQEDLT